MTDSISRYLADDHRRLEDALRRATSHATGIDLHAYSEFRSGLLRHIGMEEKILLRAAQTARGGDPIPLAARLRLDHGALAALLVPSPTNTIIGAILAILAVHILSKKVRMVFTSNASNWRDPTPIKSLPACEVLRQLR